MGNPLFITIFLMALCCVLPVLLVAIGLGAFAVLIKSNLLLILIGLVLVIGIGYVMYRRRCNTCNKKQK